MMRRRRRDVTAANKAETGKARSLIVERHVRRAYMIIVVINKNWKASITIRTWVLY